VCYLCKGLLVRLRIPKMREANIIIKISRPYLNTARNLLSGQLDQTPQVVRPLRYNEYLGSTSQL
jgi:hypothetical protein